MGTRPSNILAPAESRTEPGWQRFGVYALLLFTVTVWGGSFVAARMVLAPNGSDTATLTPTMLAAVRFLLASAIFLPILFRQHRRAQPLKLGDIPTFLLLGQLGIAAYFWLQYTGVQLTNAGTSAVIVVGVIPLATMLVSGFALKEPFGGKKLLGLGLGAIGVGVVVSQRGLQLATDSGYLFGAFCLVANALSFAVYSVLIRGVRNRYDSLTTTAGMTIAGTLGLVLLSLVSEDWRTLASISTGQWLSIFYLALMCSVLGYFFYNYALSQIEASKTAVWIYLEPPIAVVFGALLLGEAVTFQMVVGGLIILSGLYLTQTS